VTLHPFTVSPRFACGPWWLLRAGPVLPETSVGGEVWTLIASADGAGLTVDEQRARRAPVALVPPGRSYSITEAWDHSLIVYIDHRSAIGAALDARVRRRHFGEARAVRRSMVWRPDNWSRAEEAVHRLVELVTGGRTSPTTSWWWHHPNLHAAIADVWRAPPDGTSDLERLATRAALSAERLGEALIADLGHTATSYMRWATLMSVLERWADGEALTSAAKAHRFDSQESFAEELGLSIGLKLSVLVGSSCLAP
jgi:hypothetical protein